jgi:ribosome-associated toxin RatA of RatAB toxin-antitoxin module
MRLRSSPASRALLIGGLALLAPLGIAASADSPDLTWVDSARLEAGEIVLSFGGSARFQGQIRAAVLIDALPQRIWRVLADCESAPEYVPHVLSCRLLETLEGGRAQLFEQEVKLVWFLPALEHVFRLDFQPYSRMDVRRVSGPFEALEGIWWLLPDEGRGTQLVYELTFRPGLPMPLFVVGATLKRDMPVILDAIRERAQAGD